MSSRPTIYPLWGSLSIERHGDCSLQEQVVDYFRNAIIGQRLPRGHRLPSSRQLAIDHGISRTTAVEAYERLLAEGYIVSRPGAGLFVAQQVSEDLRPRGLSVKAPTAWRAIQAKVPALDGRTYQLPLAPGMPAIDLFPWRDWRRHVGALEREAPLNEIGHGDPIGERPLREAIADYLGAMKAISCDPDQIVVVNGTTQLFDVALQLVGSPRAAIWLEDPGYPFLHEAARRASITAIPVPVDAHGFDLKAAMAAGSDATLALVSPSHHVPTGVGLSLERREALVDWADRAGGWIVENEFDADYRFCSAAQPTCFSLSRAGRVVLVGSVSKPFAPGLRIGYIVLPPALVERAYRLGVPQAPVITQLAIARMSQSGQLASHLRHLRVVHAERRRLLLDALHQHADDLLNFNDAPEAGLRLLAHLPDGADDEAIVADCLAEGVKLEWLSTCYRQAPAQPGLLFGFGSTRAEQIEPAVYRASQVLRAHRG